MRSRVFAFDLSLSDYGLSYIWFHRKIYRALCLVGCLPSRREYEVLCPEVATQGPMATCVAFVGDILTRLGRLPTCWQLAAEDVSVVGVIFRRVHGPGVIFGYRPTPGVIFGRKGTLCDNF